MSEYTPLPPTPYTQAPAPRLACPPVVVVIAWFLFAQAFTHLTAISAVVQWAGQVDMTNLFDGSLSVSSTSTLQGVHALLNVVLAVLQVVAGIGLLRLFRWGQRLALAVLVMMAAMQILFTGLMLVQNLAGPTLHVQLILSLGSLAAALLLYAVMTYLLLHPLPRRMLKMEDTHGRRTPTDSDA